MSDHISLADARTHRATAESNAYQAGLRDGFSARIAALRGPRVPRPPNITDDQWVHWYGATRSDDGSLSAPMSVAHMIPNPAHSKPSAPNHQRALASQRAAG